MHRAKEYLLRYRADEVRYEQLKEQYERLHAEAVGLRSPRLDGVRVQGGGGDALDLKVAGLEELEQRLRKMFVEVADRKAEMLGEIQRLHDARRMKILYLRYIKHKPLDDIAEEMHFSHDWVRHMHGEALDEFARINL